MYQLKIKEGDLVILATDGVFDNLFKKEILSIVEKHAYLRKVRTRHSAIQIAKAVADAAHSQSKSCTGQTPYSVKLKEQVPNIEKLIKSNNESLKNLSLEGGKVDDITVLALWIAEKDSRGTNKSGHMSFDRQAFANM